MAEKDAVHRYFESVNEHDWGKLAGAVAESVVRHGPHKLNDVVEGRRAYVDFNDRMIGSKGRYAEHWIRPKEILYTPDRRRAFATATEMVRLPGQEGVELDLAFAFEITADDLLSRIDIYWKAQGEPARSLSRAGDHAPPAGYGASPG